MAGWRAGKTDGGMDRRTDRPPAPIPTPLQSRLGFRRWSSARVKNSRVWKQTGLSLNWNSFPHKLGDRGQVTHPL